VRGVVERRRVGEAGPVDDQQAESEGEHGRPLGRNSMWPLLRSKTVHETSQPSLRRRLSIHARAGLLACGSSPYPRLPVSGGICGWLAAHSCGGSCGFGTPIWVLPHRIPI
jgi:hypothetical protein